MDPEKPHLNPDEEPPMSDQNLEAIRQLVADTFGLDLASVTEATGPETVENWDSMSHLNLMLGLESQFGVTVEPDEIPTLVTVRAITDKVTAGQG